MRSISILPSLAIIAVLSSGAARLARSERGPGPCDSPTYHQFDFFLGEWDAYDVGPAGKLIGHNSVTRMVGGCALREVYRQNDGLRGESFSTWDAKRRVWHQSWVTNRGSMLLLDGALADGRMVFHGPDGEGVVIRGTWIPMADGVRETAERSSDGGRTWAPLFDMVFRPHRRAR